ncbi:MAG TPA: hypothetical protein VGH79_01045 [Gaiellaceae bacterium]|jgi:hypothetical protein
MSEEPKVTRIEDSTIEAEGGDAEGNEVVGIDAKSATFLRNSRVNVRAGKGTKRITGMEITISDDDPPSCVCGARFGATNTPFCPSCGRPLS